MSGTPLQAIDAGLMEYRQCLGLQRRLHAAVVGGGPSCVLFVEHPPVLTFGKNADKGHLRLASSLYQEMGVALIDTDRGGEVTAHMPGQLVVYPILRLADFGLTPRRHVELMESAVIKVLAGFNVTAARDPDYPGVWVGERKICAVGVRIKERVTMHGLALNVDNDLELFAQIVPCGIQGRSVTSMRQEIGTVELAAVQASLSNLLGQSLGVAVVASKLAMSRTIP